jgi:hypothetical protein
MDRFFPLVHANADLVPVTTLGAGGIVDEGSLNAPSGRSGKGTVVRPPASQPGFDYCGGVRVVKIDLIFCVPLRGSYAYVN